MESYTKNSRIIFIGNTFAEQLQHHKYFETLLYQSFPERNLTVRNLAWSADEVDLQPRPLHFPSLSEQLSLYQPDIILAFFGTNEAFKGPDSLANFKEQLSTYLQDLTAYPFQTERMPEIILFTPLATIGGFLPDPSTHQENLEFYTQGMKEVADGMDIPFVDLFNTQKVITTSGTNTYDKIITTRKCTLPNDNLKQIYNILKTKHQPFTKRKSVVHKLEAKKTEATEKQILLSG